MVQSNKVTVRGSAHTRSAADIECHVAPERAEAIARGMAECGYTKVEQVSN